MTRLIAYVANRTDRLLSALNEEHAAIGATPAPDADAWGIGFYQSGDVLLKKRPYRNGDPVSWDDIANNVPTDSAIIHLRAATIGNYRAENTHPFRMRQWLFAHTGTINAFDTIRSGLLAAVPDWHGQTVTLRASWANGALTLRACSATFPSWRMLRLAPFAATGPVTAGPYCCAPERAGLTVRFTGWRTDDADSSLH